MARVTMLLGAGLLASLLTAAWAADEGQPRVNLDVRDAAVTTVLSTIAEKTGANLAVTERVRGNVTVRLQDMTPEQALRAVAAAAGATVTKDGDVYLVDRRILPPTRPAPPADSPVVTVAPPAAGPTAVAAGNADATRQVVRKLQVQYIDAATLAAALGGSVIGSGLYNPLLSRSRNGNGYGLNGGYGNNGGYGGGYGSGYGRGNGYGSQSGLGGWRGY